VEKLRTGEAKFDDEASEGRSRSLGASLDYGFQNVFSEDERKVLALLHFFQGFVDVQALRIMVNPKGDDCDWGLGPKDFTDESGVALLDQVAEIGLLTTHGSGHYSIHPALPWYFKSLFEQYYFEEPKVDSRPSSEDQSTVHSRTTATHAFVSAMAMLGDYYHDQYGGGNRQVIPALHAEEANLLFARSLARQHAWWDALMRVMQGLFALYDSTARSHEWKRLVNEIVPDFVDKEIGAPLPGREDDWDIITQYLVNIAIEARDLAQAENLQHITVEWDRGRVEPLLALHPQELNSGQRNSIRSLAVSLEGLGNIGSTVFTVKTLAK
jgi:hypothetical protein